MNRPIVWSNEHAKVEITQLSDGKYQIEVFKIDPSIILPKRNKCTTSYPLELIKQIYDVKGPLWLCDEIKRDEEQAYVANAVERSIFSYVPKERFKDGRILDFGCGRGASSAVIARMLPHAELIGTDLDEESIAIARARAKFHSISNATFLTSPDPRSLPDIGHVDYVFLTAVYEHLLPEERRTVLPLLWKALKPGGVMFIFLTPYRWWPIERHTSGGLPLLNYFPKFLAHSYTKRFARTNIHKDDWQTLLRKGIRGGSPGEIMRILKPYNPKLLPPTEIGGRDSIDLWWYFAPKNLSNRVFRLTAKLLKLLTGYDTVRTVEIALHKERSFKQ